MTKLGLHLAGPGFPHPVGRRRTFIESVINLGFRATILTISMCVLGVVGVYGFLLVAGLLVSLGVI